ncbi:MAG TPA: TonB-dependent receptor [Candidatus Acidoferrales bacterium]|nr:TonB-dependent receptor [Candidatus Acidoferrales bacterium]
MPRKALLSLLLLLCGSPVFAQFKASLQGTVVDPSGNAVAAAKVTVTDEATGVSHTVLTSDSGFYRVNQLPPGTYTVAIRASGFKASTSNGVRVEAEQPRGFDVTLQVGDVQETVTVSALPESLRTEDANLSSTITSQQVLALPQFGRDPYELLRLTPGVFGDASRQGNGNSLILPQQPRTPGGSNNEIFQTENQVQIAANGQRVTANTYSLDGVSVDSLSNGGAAVITPNQESIQEMVVTSASYDASQGRNSGAQVEVVSKSGTNDFHGSALIHFNDKGLNAFNRFYGANNVPLSPISCEGGSFTIVAQHCPSRNDQKYRDFAGSFGGPILHNKLFFFFSYEGLRLNNTVILRDSHLETPAFENYVEQAEPGSIAAKIFSTPGVAPRIVTAVSQTDCCSLVTNPSDPNFHPLGMWYVPGNTPNMGQAVGNGPDGIPDWGVFDLRVPNSSSGNQYNGRVDYTLGSNQFFANTFISQLKNVNGGDRPIDDVALMPTNYVGTLGWTRTITSFLLNEARLNFTRFAFDQLIPTGNTNYGIPQIELFDFDAAMGNAGTGGTLLGITQAGTTPGKLAENTFGFRDTLNWVHGNHALRFGGEYAREQNNDDEPGFERPVYQFRGLLNFANDACCFFEGLGLNPQTGSLPNGQRYFRTSAYSLFVQDSWKFRPNLTLTLGLRWEYFPPITETQGLMSNYVFGSEGLPNGSVQHVAQLYQPDKNNFGPRLGFSWSPNVWGNKPVLRGGFGIVYDRPFETEFTNIRQNTPYFAQLSTCCFFDPGPITGPPPGSGIQYGIGSSRLAGSFAPNPNFAFGVAPDGALCADPTCSQITKVDLFGSPANEPTPYVYVFSLQTQVQPVNNWLVSVGYQGSRSRKLVRTIDLNRFHPGDTFDGTIDGVQNASPDGVPCGPTNPACPAPVLVGNPRFNRVFFPMPDVNASFDALTAQLTHQFSRGLSFSFLYTLSHTIDTSSNEIGFQQTDPFTQSIDKASSDYDVRQHFQLSSFWELPLFRGRHDFAGSLLGGWTLGGILEKHTGFPFTALIGACNPSQDRNGDSYCPDMPLTYAGGMIANPSKQQWENGVFPDPAASFPGATNPVTPGTFGPGCRCRNIFAGPGYTSVDLSFGKNFSLPRTRLFGESAKLELRSNFFNAFNILNLEPLAPATAPTDITNTGQFGRPLDGLSGRVIEFQARFSF